MLAGRQILNECNGLITTIDFRVARHPLSIPTLWKCSAARKQQSVSLTSTFPCYKANLFHVLRIRLNLANLHALAMVKATLVAVRCAA